MKYIDADQIRAEIERRRKELEGHNYYLDNSGQALGYGLALDDIGKFLDTLPEQPVEGLDVTDFCKPIDPGIAQCVADHWCEMTGEESTNKKPVEGLEEEVISYFQGLWPGTDTPEECNTHMHFTPPAIMRLARHFAEWQKAKILEQAVEGIAHPDDCEIWVNLFGYGYDIKDGDKVRVIVIKEDEK